MIPPNSPAGSQRRGGVRPPSALTSLVATALFTGTVLAITWALANPAVATGIVALVVGLPVAIHRTRRRLAARRRAGRTRLVCLDGVGLCVEL